MNFLKKKIKTVVHGGKRNKDDDDDDFDNYVPEVPPHPSTLTDPNGGFIQSLNASDTQFASFSTANFGSTPPLAIDQSEQESAESNEPKLSLEELKALEEEHKRVEKEKLKQQEDSKKDCEEWKYFLSLTAKVDAVTSKTQTTLTKLKDESAVNEINKFEDICYSDKFDRSAPKGAGGWVAFGEQEEFNPADPFLKQPAEEPPAEPPVLDEAAQKIARELIDDFGFTNPALGIAVPSENVDLFATEAEVDPFDTSFIDIETIKSGGTVKPAELIRNLDSKDEEFDPFDTSHIEAAVTNSLVLENDDDDKNDVHEDEDVK